MTGRRGKKTTESIRTYFRTRAGSVSVERDILPDNFEAENATRDKMADTQAAATGASNDSLAEITSLIKGLDAKANKLDMKVTDGFANLNEKLEKVTEKVEALEVEVDAIKQIQKKDEESLDRLKAEVQELRQSLLSTQAYARKYHLLLYGVDGHENQPKDTIARVRRFAIENLQMEESRARNTVIRNAHRLQKHGEAPATIVMVFLYWDEREAFLRAGPNLRGSRMRVCTDLPPELKRRRGQLASHAYQMRQDEHIQTRIREKGADVWLETRKNSGSPWARRDVTL